MTRKLISELPAIFNWSILGLRRLRERGRFTQPIGGLSLLQQMRDIGSPVGAFVRECCSIEDGAKILVKELFDRWCDWCRESGRKDHGNVQIFGRNLTSCSLKIEMKRQGPKHDRAGYYVGIRLLDATERAERGENEVGVVDVSPSVVDAKKVSATPKHYEKQCENDLFASVSPVSPIIEGNPPLCASAGARAHAHPPTLAHTHMQYSPPNIDDTGDTGDTDLQNSGISSVIEGVSGVADTGTIDDTIDDTDFQAFDLYVNLKMDFRELPRGLAVEVLVVSGVTYYLATPSIMVYLESYQDLFDGGELAGQKDEYLKCIQRVWAYVSARYTLPEISLARNSDVIDLPEPHSAV